MGTASPDLVVDIDSRGRGKIINHGVLWVLLVAAEEAAAAGFPKDMGKQKNKRVGGALSGTRTEVDRRGRRMRLGQIRGAAAVESAGDA